MLSHLISEVGTMASFVRQRDLHSQIHLDISESHFEARRRALSRDLAVYWELMRKYHILPIAAVACVVFFFVQQGRSAQLGFKLLNSSEFLSLISSLIGLELEGESPFLLHSTLITIASEIAPFFVFDELSGDSAMGEFLFCSGVLESALQNPNRVETWFATDENRNTKVGLLPFTSLRCSQDKSHPQAFIDVYAPYIDNSASISMFFNNDDRATRKAVATALATEIRENLRFSLGSGLLADGIRNGGTEIILELTETVYPDPADADKRAKLIVESDAFRSLERSEDIEEAALLLNTLSPEHSKPIIERIVHNGMKSDFIRVSEVIQNLPDSQVKQQAIETFAAGIEPLDPEAAAEWRALLKP